MQSKRIINLAYLVVFTIGCIFMAVGGKQLTEIIPAIESILVSVGLYSGVKQFGLVVGFVMASVVFNRLSSFKDTKTNHLLMKIEIFGISVLFVSLFFI